MVIDNFLKFSCIRNLDNKIVSRIQSKIFWHRKIRLCHRNKSNAQFVPIINNSVTIGLNFLLINISGIISSKTINISRFLFGFYSSIRLQISYISFEHSIKALESLKCLHSLFYDLKSYVSLCMISSIQINFINIWLLIYQIK